MNLKIWIALLAVISAVAVTGCGDKQEAQNPNTVAAPEKKTGEPAKHGLQNAPPPVSAMPGAKPPLEAGSKMR